MNNVKTILRKGGKKVKTTNYIVKSIVFDFKTHKSYGIKYERIDLINNRLFRECKNEFHIENNYENFWNRLNDIKSGWYKNRSGIVKVIEVYPIEEFSSKFPRYYKNLIKKTSRLMNGFYPIETDYNWYSEDVRLSIKKKNKLSLMIDGFIDKVKTLLNFKLKTIKN
jgi:hypothetical protein|tara:strand:+ start:44 stop:544 length:501 start_codon:yes stop_codon:yes gene_type:complete